MQPRHWDNLVSSIRRGQCILLVGSDLPILATTGSEQQEMTTFGAELSSRLAKELEEDGKRCTVSSLAAVAQQYEDTEGFGPGFLRTAAERVLRSPQYHPSRIHEMLAGLPFPLVMTTAQDQLLESALEQVKKSPSVQRYHMRGDKRENPEFDVFATPNSPVVFHLFGIANQPASLVLSENDILDFLIRVVSERPGLPNSLVRALKRDGQNFLFVGFGIRQWDLRVLLKVLLRSLELNRSGPAFAAEPLTGLLPQDRSEIVLFYQRGTRVHVEDEEIATFLEKLTDRFKTEGGYIEQATPQFGTRIRVFISYAREDEDLAARVYHQMQKADFDPWFDREALEGGDDWDRKIRIDLETSHFVLVLYTKALCHKNDNYVNTELTLATQRASRVRGSFLIPLRVGTIADEDRVDLLKPYNEMELNESSIDEDLAKVISTMKREYQRRNR